MLKEEWPPAKTSWSQGKRREEREIQRVKKMSEGEMLSASVEHPITMKSLLGNFDPEVHLGFTLICAIHNNKQFQCCS